MIPNKYLIVADRRGGPLNALIPDLSRLGFRVLSVDGAEAALRAMSASPRVTMLAISETCKGGGPLFRAARRQHPRLPMLWHGDTSTVVSHGSVEARLNAKPSAAELEAHARAMLRSARYSTRVVRALGAAVTLALASFDARVAVRETFVKATRTPLEQLTAMQRWRGGGGAGQVSVGAARTTARSALHAFSPRADRVSDELLADLLGEIANRVVGRLIEGFQGGTVEFAAPVAHLPGRASPQREAPPPSLVLQLSGPAGSFYAELSGQVASSPVVETLPGDAIEAGQIIPL